MSGLLLDTHTWLWVERGVARTLPADFLRELDAMHKRNRVYISNISVLEVARLVDYNQISIGMTIDRFVAETTGDGGLQILDLSTRILIESTRLPGTFHRDPADRILAATAREHELTLVTRDSKLLDYAAQGYIKTRKIR